MKLGHVVLYVRDVDAVARFYRDTFAMTVHRRDDDRITELRGDGARLMLHPLAKGRKPGQTLVKLVFDVADVDRFVADHDGFGKVHQADGYAFANGKDPAGNAVQVSSRTFAIWND